ncbi:hypothetical protein [Fluviispira sanaruensis]|uniref:Uncharacterized protein n=1 Tax=Fluviispira sanaruensis TaxID=2493639 RepID=A0A4P2VMD7_FLUSA|nr:hypothetical protein [Fluviispira sanaruensis]BBH54121.1 hypothetical protein JCM31447_25790 [Fluviispira sanaruensis]
MKTELFLIPIAAVSDSLRVLVTKDPTSDRQTFPSIMLKQDLHLHGGTRQILRDLLSGVPFADLENWLNSARCKDRIVDVYDRDLLFEQSQSIAIVRAIALPQEFSSHAKGVWLDAENLFSQDSILAPDSRLFLRECLNQVPLWVKNTTFTFELLSQVFSIQDLRLLVGMLSSQEIDPGNFHRRLKRLDILRPLVSGQQRVHKWEFAWEKSDVLAADGLIP